MDNGNPYLNEVHAVLPRLLSLFDADPLSPTYGMGDRFRWAWKLIDFGNGTFQGACHGLARLFTHKLLPAHVSSGAFFRRVEAMFQAARTLTRANGSLEEAFPHESSFCVTALAAYDLLSTIEVLSSRLDQRQREDYLSIVAPMVRFLHRADESHGFISNHLATAAAALYKWHALGGEEGQQRGALFLRRILSEQSEEGWFREYEGADPGYQSLCTYYLADLHRLRPDLGLLEPLRRSLRFLWHFAHPDGSFGGLYGSRNTRFCAPAGLEALAAEIPEAAALADGLRASIQLQRTVTLSAMDEPNLVPMFNAYCWAATLFEERAELSHGRLQLPCMKQGVWQQTYPGAGLLVDKGQGHYTIISWHKGGVCYHFADEPDARCINAGVAVRRADGRLFSSQSYQPSNRLEAEGDQLTVEAPMVAMKKQLPSPLQFAALRLLAITVMRFDALRNFVKRCLVRMLITGKEPIPIRNRRTIRLGERLSIADQLLGDAKVLKKYSVVEFKGAFSDLHMASQGYWQRQDTEERA